MPQSPRGALTCLAYVSAPSVRCGGDFAFGPEDAFFTWSYSPALDAGNPAGCLDEKGLSLGGDQRRARRVVDGPDGDSVARCDIGSYEYGAPAGIFFGDFERGTTDDWSSAVP